MSIEKEDFKSYIKNFKFKELFNELGWDTVRKKFPIKVNDQVFELDAVAEKRDFLIMQCSPQNSGKMPDAYGRKKIDREITKQYFEHLLIFVDSEHSKQIWQLSIREPNKPIVVRETTYHVHQAPELLFQKLRDLFFTIDEEDKIGLVDVKQRVTESFNINTERVTKQFYDRFKKEHTVFLNFIEGIEENVDKDWYGSLMLNRLMFIYFIQKKGFLDDNKDYLKHKLKTIQQKRGKNQFYSFYKDFLLVLFHKGLGAPEHNDELIKDIGRIPYLNGGLFDVHQIEKQYRNINIKDDAFERVFDFFDQYEWHLDTRITATGRDINPDVIGYIFEKYINDRAAMGAYYTREDITEYISKNTIIPFLFDEVKKKVANAFQKDSSLWKLLKDNPDRYIYESVRKGTERDLPDEIAEGLDTSKPNLLDRRKAWNKLAPPEFALPTEIWREVFERRKRYFEIKEKIENGEIKEINDFITYNLDIRQFAQDAVQEYEGSDFINAFYMAITKISVLDPTCGSGAFLFAALNILEPLYQTCIDRMKIFVEEDDLKGGKKFEQFRKVLQEIKNHPNEKYYIFKSIILNNLYGVDIMHEAVEIAKLRLFLKLVATVDIDYSKPNLGLEPLPDLDFNLRAGNTLVGFTSLKDVENVVEGMDKIFNKNFVNNIKEQAEYVKMAYQRFRDASIENDPTLREAKLLLAEKLDKLNKELDIYQARLYDKYIDVKRNREKFIEWKKSHQPFHWFAEFYEIIQEHGGFDVIIGNPPYVEYRKVQKKYRIIDFKTLNSGNLYSFILERNQYFLHKRSKHSMIIPHSAFCTDRMESLINIFHNKQLWISTYDIRPSKLFNGVDQRLAIFIEECASGYNKIFATKYIRWNEELRNMLFQNLTFVINENIIYKNAIPKNGYKQISHIYDLIKKNNQLSNILVGQVLIYYHNAPRYWIRALNYIPYFYSDKYGMSISSHIKSLGTSCEEDALILTAILNSSLYYIWFLVFSNSRDFTLREIERYTFDPRKLNKILRIKLLKLSKELMNDYAKNCSRKHTYYKASGTVIYDEFYPKKSKNIIDEIDKVLAQHYGFTEEELDFIINYDIKYRMGDEL
ncbi:MAG: type IIS restriction/modification enzyme - site-specific DNA methyltransferase (adenine specific) [Candidatus Scalindua rubra]|uniref:site-specific DNA-methyltransferase (adenine-specific) n=1 Tax=Candidatus Scalindua rubra TaxID=1872076 RepID=A0A1E3X9R0_9BACT|nr:MAG: type IIS restriction/modification enzyme - site-specific DNA methyltransferase (adenine specific) [Candidatus Scalindua rubra]